jgi:hypothetical protein
VESGAGKPSVRVGAAPPHDFEWGRRWQWSVASGESQPRRKVVESGAGKPSVRVGAAPPHDFEWGRRRWQWSVASGESSATSASRP